MKSMKNAVASPPRIDAPARDENEQLTLLPRHEVAARFRLPEETRRRGLRHVAEIRQMLAERQDDTARAKLHRLPPRRQQAA